MRRALALAMAASALLVAAPATAATRLVLDRGSEAVPARYRHWVAVSSVPTPPVAVTLHLRICPGAPSWAVGCAVAANREIYLDAGGDSRHALMHELGHLFDFGEMSTPMRDAFRVVLRRHGAWAGAAANNPLQEKFAEAYSLCSRHRALTSTYYALYAYTPTPAQHRRACDVIRRAAVSPWHLAGAAAPPVVYMAATGCLGVWRYVDRAGSLTVRYSCLGSLIRLSSWDYAPGARPSQVCGAA